MFYNPDLHDDEIRLVLRETKDADPSKGHVPSYKFDIALLSGEAIGKCTLRVGHNDNTYFGGNIGYSIDEPYRGHRFAAKATKLLLALASMHGMDYLIITCDVSNVASSRTCLLAGGMFLCDAVLPESNDMYQRGLRTVKVYKFLVPSMRTLFVLDKKDYDTKGELRNRHSVRGIIIKDHRIAMVHLLSKGYFKFPGGGSEGTETQRETLVREVREESGLVVKPETIRSYGIVHRAQLDRRGYAFTQDNYYYLCDVEDQVQSQMLTEKEAEDQYTLEFVDPLVAIKVSRSAPVDQFVELSIQRETGVLEQLIAEGYFN